MFHHTPVLYQEVISYLSPHDQGIYVDGTVGGGGHAEGILMASQPTGFLYAFDQDENALGAAQKRLASMSERVKFVHDNFARMPGYIKAHEKDGVDGILLDIGVSSPQIDEAQRGFSYMHDAPLDMRMNPKAALTAATIVNAWSQKDLEHIISTYGEEKWATRIAQIICERRPIQTTFELVDIIERAIPKKMREKNSHVGKRTFQALRIATNDELNILENTIEKAVDVLKPGGRLAIISFHSLEDRIVKNKYRYLASACICSPDLPICQCDKKQKIKIITKKPITASKTELQENSRARSAKLRVCEKLA